MINEIVRFQKIDFPHVFFPDLDHLQSHGNHSTSIVCDVFVVIQNSIPIELHHFQDTLNFRANEETLDLPTFSLSEKTAIVLFLDPTLEIHSTLEFIILHFDLHQDYFLDLRLCLEYLSKIHNQVPPEIMTTTLKAFQSQWTKLKLICIPLK